MLEGIEIINKTEILVEQSCPNPVVDIIFNILIIVGMSYMIGFALGGILILALMGSSKYESVARKIVVRAFSSFKFIAISVIVTFATIINIGVRATNDNRTKEIPSGEYIYEVTIIDDVKLKEFYEHYEILEVEGDIFTIKERE